MLRCSSERQATLQRASCQLLDEPSAMTSRCNIFSLVAITVDLGPLHGDKPAAHHLFQFRQEGCDFRGLVHDLHDDRQIKGESQDMCSMEVSRPAVAHRAPQHRGSGEVKFACFQHDGSIEWAMHVFIGFPKEYPEQRTLFRQVPGLRVGRRHSG
jgi:hypothetical protein